MKNETNPKSVSSAKFYALGTVVSIFTKQTQSTCLRLVDPAPGPESSHTHQFVNKVFTSILTNRPPNG
jgi:hypothetical protein